MISINATLVVQVIQFLILMFVLNRVLFRPMLNTISEREEYLRKSKEKINALENEMERLREEYASRQSNTRKEAAQERAELRRSGKEEMAGFLQESRKEVEKIRAEADKEAEKELENNRAKLQDKADQLAYQIMEKVIGRRISQ